MPKTQLTADIRQYHLDVTTTARTILQPVIIYTGTYARVRQASQKISRKKDHRYEIITKLEQQNKTQEKRFIHKDAFVGKHNISLNL